MEAFRNDHYVSKLSFTISLSLSYQRTNVAYARERTNEERRQVHANGGLPRPGSIFGHQHRCHSFLADGASAPVHCLEHFRCLLTMRLREET